MTQNISFRILTTFSLLSYLILIVNANAAAKLENSNPQNEVAAARTDLDTSPTSARLFNLGSLFGQTPNYPYGYGGGNNYYPGTYNRPNYYYPSTTTTGSGYYPSTYYPNTGWTGSNYYPSYGGSSYYPTNGVGSNYYPTTNILGGNGAGYGGYGGYGGYRLKSFFG